MNRTVALVVAALVLLGAAGYFLFFQAAPQPERPAVQEEEPAVWPLTGEPVGDGDDIKVRTLSIKIDNLPAARPQAGVAEADVVYELLAEGGITRFHAIFHSSAPERVGPVRSARPPDVRIVRQYRSVLLFSGANNRVERLIADSGIDALTETTGGRALKRSSARRAPHNLYANLGALREVASERGFDAEAEPPSLLFGEPSAEGTAAAEVEVRFSPATEATWQWNEDESRYERELDGEPQGDEDADTGYLAANVILLFAEVEEGTREGTTDVLLDASGEALLFRDGLRYPATWTAGATEPPSFETADGAELPLAAGPTWIEVLPASERDRFGE